MTISNPNGAYNGVVPNLPVTGSRTNVILGTAIFPAVTCPITSIILIDTGTNVAYTGTWLAVDSAGTVTVDQNQWGTQSVKVQYVYATATLQTTAMSVTYTCPTLTTNPITTQTHTYTIPNSSAARTDVITGSTYVTTTSDATQCAFTFQFIVSATNAAYTGGSWI